MEQYYTFSGRQAGDFADLTPAMEDYVEMLYRLSNFGTGTVRNQDIAAHLHVKPSSSTKMLRLLRDTGYVSGARYGCVSLTEQGRVCGAYLLYRHDVVQQFLNMLSNGDDVLEQAERIEHFLSPQTVKRLAQLTEKLKEACFP